MPKASHQRDHINNELEIIKQNYKIIATSTQYWIGYF